MPANELTTRLATLIMTDNSPDIAVFGRAGYDCITKGLAQPVDPYIDFDHYFYQDILEAYRQTEWSDGQHYNLIRAPLKLSGILYNTKLFEEAGQTDPWEEYQAGNWTWNTFRDAAREIASDTNGDGETDVYGFGFFRPQVFIHTTGKPWGSLDAKTMTVTNNLHDSDIARAMNFIYDMMYVDKSGMPTSDVLKKFQDEQLAMILFDTSPISFPEVVSVTKKGHTGLVPMPRDPQADKHYAYSYITDDFIPKGAKNPQAAIAFNALMRYRSIYPEGKARDEKKRREEYGFTELMQQQYNEIHAFGTGVEPVYERMEMIGYNAAWDCVYGDLPWTTALKTREAESNAWVAELLEVQEVEASSGPKNIELFEKYGSNTEQALNTAKLYPISDGSANYKIYLDKKEAKEGNYAARVEYDFTKEEIKYGGFTKNLNSTWNTNNTMTLWAKGDGKEQEVSIQFYAGDVPWVYTLKVEGTQGKVYEIPFKDFTHPEWFEEEAALDLTTIKSIHFSFNGQGANRHIYLDDIRVIRQ